MFGMRHVKMYTGRFKVYYSSINKIYKKINVSIAIELRKYMTMLDRVSEVVLTQGDEIKKLKQDIKALKGK
jgi:hypothetical protein